MVIVLIEGNFFVCARSICLVYLLGPYKPKLEIIFKSENPFCTMKPKLILVFLYFCSLYWSGLNELVLGWIQKFTYFLCSSQVLKKGDTKMPLSRVVLFDFLKLEKGKIKNQTMLIHLQSILRWWWCFFLLNHDFQHFKRKI